MPKPINYNKKKRQLKFGKRLDGTDKGEGYFGPLKRPDGKVSTEISIGVGFKGRETQIPTLVPTILEKEKKHLLSGGKATPSILKKAVSHARKRLGSGLSPFAGPSDYGKIYPQRYAMPPRKKR